MSVRGSREAALLLSDLLTAPDRDRSPGALPVIALAADEDPAFLSIVEGVALRIVELERRGAWHGEWAELDPREIPGLDDEPADPRAEWSSRWRAARPILLPGLVDPDEARDDLDEHSGLHAELREPGGLQRFLEEAADDLGPEFVLGGSADRASQASGDARDIARGGVTRTGSPGPALTDLWAKAGWLSTHDDDASLRLRLSFGREVEEDASRDLTRHRAVAELAERLLPEARIAHECAPLARLLDDWVGSECFLTQHIAYWNAPGGGALFHHDAFDESPIGGQRGVVYLQLTGSTAWIALSLADLATHVTEFMVELDQGEAPWVRSALFGSDTAFASALRVARDRRRLESELARPGCGTFAGLVNRGPEFSAVLADAGHAWIIDPGDAIVLPNHGLASTCMHSVFCASEEPAYALSMAIREADPGDPDPAADRRGSGRRRGRGRSRRPRRSSGRRRGSRGRRTR